MWFAVMKLTVIIVFYLIKNLNYLNEGLNQLMKISAIFYFQKYCDMLQNREK